MGFQVENLEEKNMVKLTIEVSAEEFEKGLQTAFNKQKNKISIPGFRKGKVSRQVVEKMYGPSMFYEEAANSIIPEAYADAADESKLEIVSQPEIDVTQIEKGKPFIFTATVAIKPEVTLGQYKGVEVEKVNAEVTEDDVNAELDRVRKQNSRMVTVDRAIAMDDTAIINYEGFVDGEAFQGGKGENYSLKIGSHSFIDTFEDQLVGKTAGEEFDVNVTFPADYHSENLAGKPACFKVKVNEVKVEELPELNDDFASDVSEFDTLDEYKEDVKKNLAERKAKSAESEKESKAIEKAVENASMDIPEAMIQYQVRQMAEEFAQRIQSQGLSMDQYFQFTGSTADKLFEEMRPEAERRTKNALVLEAVVKAENITVSDEEYEEELKKMAEMYNMELDKIKELVNEEAAEQIKKDAALDKAVKLIASEAKEV
ncbi:MAG: trigger factor [Lachnospiraceae bacterium]|nr:trigger factor [Lachnospiraceae bacterium]